MPQTVEHDGSTIWSVEHPGAAPAQQNRPSALWAKVAATLMFGEFLFPFAAMLAVIMWPNVYDQRIYVGALVSIAYVLFLSLIPAIFVWRRSEVAVVVSIGLQAVSGLFVLANVRLLGILWLVTVLALVRSLYPRRTNSRLPA